MSDSPSWDTGSTDGIELVEYLSNLMREKRQRGAILIFAPMLIFVVPFLVPSTSADLAFLGTIVVTFLVFMIGLILLAASASIRYYIYSIKILQRASPPDPVITEDYAVMERNGTYLFTSKKVSGTLYCVAFKHMNPTAPEELDIPKIFWKWSPSILIEGLRVHNVEGKFSVLTPERRYISGQGILLAVPLLGQYYMLHVPEFSKKQLLAVVDYAARFSETWDQSET